MQKTILLLSGDGDLLAVANAFLSTQNRVLNAWSAESCLWVLRRFPVNTVLIDSEMEDTAGVERECSSRGISVRVMSGTMQAGILRLSLPELAGKALNAGQV